jgi:type IV pilus assembly protein PilX
MNANRNRRVPPAHARSQRGVALVVVLILLLITTLLGLASLRGTLLEERMSANLYDRGLAFQAAEAALRQGEALVNVLEPLKDFPNEGITVNNAASCVNGLCTTPGTVEAAKPRWLLDSPPWRNVTAVSNGSSGSITPQVMLEYMGKGAGWAGCEKLRPRNQQCLKSRFRITAQGGDASTGRAAVLLQTTYATP